MPLVNIFEQTEALVNTLKCNVCSEIFEDPVVVGKCGHTFCKKCINGYFGKQCLQCPLCNAPLDVKDSHEDKQLKELLPLVQRLKAIFINELLLEETDTVSNKGKKKEHGENCNTSSCNKVIKLSTKCSRNNDRFCRTPKPVKCKDPSCECLPGTPSLALNPDKANIMETPKNARSVRRRPFTSPVEKSLKRTPFRITAFSAKKRLQNNRSSPKAFEYFSPGNLQKKNAKGETLLHVAVIKNDIVKVKELLKNGASPNVKDNAGWTPLHEASNLGHLEITILLLEYGAVLNVPGQNNITPIHDALMNNRMELALYLASRGADIHVKTSLGNTALDLCQTEEEKASLLQSCSSFRTTATDLPNEKVSAEIASKVVLLSTSLNDVQKDQLQKCAELLKADIVEDFCPEVTHIVTSCDDMGQCIRTLKILQGILAGKWIVNYQWVDVCLEYQQKVDEEVFEVPGTKQQPDTHGPKCSRENAMQQFPPLFDGCHFYLHGQFSAPTPPREDICNLIHIGGGKLLSREPRPETVDLEQHMIPYHASGGPLADISHFILYQDKVPRQTNSQSNHICAMKVQWLIECISAFTFLEPDAKSKIKMDENPK